mgnify:CR=1 FL=1
MYNQAFDLYHTLFRLLHILDKYDENEKVEVERLRVWDFYLLFPNKIHTIRIRGCEYKEARIQRKFISKKDNPYNTVSDGRKFLERQRPYQMAALNYLASLGIIDVEKLFHQEVVLLNRKKLDSILADIGELTTQEKNTLSWLSINFRVFPLNGPKGLKDRTGLLISKYDGK